MISDVNISADWVKNHVPLGRLGKGEDIAGVVLFLISNNADYVHGATIDCNGGWIIT
ncbi:3-oxoacyl-[acyl-carrier-protein] reductase FabG [compost metagenome]